MSSSDAHAAHAGSTHRPLHWESWLLRLALLGLLAYQLIAHNTSGAVVAVEGFVFSLATLLVQKLSKTHTPRLLEFLYVLAIALQFFSESLKLFEVFYYWDKLVHPSEVTLSTMIVTLLLFGYRDRFGATMPMVLAAAISWLGGACIGALWEYVEFLFDWFGDANLQKSNGDTMTDLIANDIGALFAMWLAMWLYHHHVSKPEQDQLGGIMRWLTDGPARLLSRHGRLVGSVTTAVVAAVIGAGVLIDRGTPALASNLQPGAANTWAFASAAPAPDTATLKGDWVPDDRGICRENLEHPKPGSEKPGLLALAPGQVYGQDGQPFAVSTRYVEERPPRQDGSQMDAGIAFGIRSPDDYYLLEVSAIHDVLRLDRYVHGKRRDVREELYRTHGDEWHTLRLEVDGSTAQALIDGRPIFSVPGLHDTAGGVGLWARSATASCFSEATVQVGGDATQSDQALAPRVTL